MRAAQNPVIAHFLASCAGLWLALVLGAGAQAQGQLTYGAPTSVFIEGGVATHGTRSASVGISWPWAAAWQPANRALTGHFDAYLSLWNTRSPSAPGGHEALSQIAVVPVLRWRFNEGRSAWFTEGGIGLSYLDQLYQTAHKNQSTRFNFADHLALGRNYGARRQHELALRVVHISNADIKKPNPGENFLQLRYSFAL